MAGVTRLRDGTARCAAHPARPAVDECPVCSRPRCGADAGEGGATGCRVCGGRVVGAAGTAEGGRRPMTAGEAFARCGLACWPAAMAGAAVESEYVQTSYLSLIVPLLLGVLCAGVVMVAARGARGRVRTLTRVVAALYAVLGTAYGFTFVVGGESPFSPAGRVLPPYVAAVAGAWLWSTQPRRARRQGRGRGSVAK